MNLANEHEWNDERMERVIGQCDRLASMPDDAFVERLRGAVLNHTRAQPSLATTRRPTGRMLARCAIAASIAVAVLYSFWPRTPTVWAQVQDAIDSKPWIRMRAKLADGTTRENWISIPGKKTAFRVGPTAQYIDVGSDVRFDYDESRGTIIRAPLQPGFGANSLMAFFHEMTRGMYPTPDEIERARVLEKRNRKVVENDKEWLDVELVLQSTEGDPALWSVARMEFRVDPDTKLPQAMTLKLLVPGHNEAADQKPIVFEIDYPAEGPADIYALGVPRDAKLDDRMPSDDAKRALKALADGRRDFDPYFALVFGEAQDYRFSIPPSLVIWRRGNQVRVESCWPFEPVPPYSEKPADTDDLTWWKSQLKHFHFVTLLVCDGRSSYQAEVSASDEKGDQRVTTWKSLATIGNGDSLSPIHVSPVSHFIPEFYSYPTIINSGTTSSVTIEPTTTPDMPHGVLLTRRTSSSHPGGYHRERYWLDGDRGYAATRSNIDELDLSRDQLIAQNAAVEDQHSMHDFQRSPKGFWYPTRVARQVAREPKDPAAKRVFESNGFKSFLLDFNVEMQDSLFTKGERKSGL